MTSGEAEEVRIDALEEARRMLKRFKTLLMSTASDAGEPDASYAPFVRTGDNAFYVYLSQLSTHTRYLQANPRAGVLLVEDERDAPELFARKRLGFACEVKEVQRDTPAWVTVMDLFEMKFGEVLSMIRPLTDFKLFQLVPTNGSFVRGFAQAYRLKPDELAAFAAVNDLDVKRG